MQPPLDEKVDHLHQGDRPSGGGDAALQVGEFRTVATGRAFIHALAGDVAVVLRAAAWWLTRSQRYVSELSSSTWHYLSRWFAASWVRVKRASLLATESGQVKPPRLFGLRPFIIGVGVIAVGAIISFFAVMVWALHDLPDRPTNHTNRPALLVEGSDGQPLGRIGPLKMTDVTRREFSEHLIQAVLAIEDRRFYNHFGIDLIGIARAAQRNTIAGEIVEGGSTISQQLVRTLYLDRKRTFTRKLREAAAAIQLERRHSKDEILARYLNSVYMGADAQGVPAAARLYFHKNVSELTLPEAAMLAGIIRAPSSAQSVAGYSGRAGARRSCSRRHGG